MPAVPAVTDAVRVYPLPGSHFAPPTTEISLRGRAIGRSSALRASTIRGSVSGLRTFTVRPHADGDGASLVIDGTFTAGETVTVTVPRLAGSVAGRTSAFGVVDYQPTAIGPDTEGIDEREVQIFASAPQLSVPTVTVTVDEASARPGRIFLASYRGPGVDGPMMLDDHGSLLWAYPVPDGERAANFQVQQWNQRPVLTWWQGEISATGDSTGSAYVMDDHYHQIAHVAGGNGLVPDLHDFVITPQGTALVLAYMHCPADLSSAGGPKDGLVIDGVIQELEIETGRVLFEWHAMDHIDLTESYQPMVTSAVNAYDAFHLNSIARSSDGSYLLSSRATHTIYRIDAASGTIEWRLGGKRSNFRIGPGAEFSSQHDARWVDADTISLFDNADGVGAATARFSSALVLRLDVPGQQATLVTARNRGTTTQSASQGSVQELADGHLFVGWGAQPYVTEFDADGTVVFAASLPPADQSYRAFRQPWTGRPQTTPAVNCVAVAGGHQVAVSWNGATEVTHWQILSGASADDLSARRTVARSGFETTTTVPDLGAWLAVRALDSGGRVLGTSDPIST